VNTGGHTTPKGSLGLVVIRANPQTTLLQRLVNALKGALDRWH
jgi:hypothetical protein